MFFFFLFRISKKTWAADGSVFFFGLAPNSTGYKVRGGIIFVVVVIDLIFLGGILADEKTCPSPFKLNVLCINGRPSEKINTMVRMDGKTDDACTNQQEERDKREQGRAEASSGNNIGSEEEEEKGGGRARRWQSV